MEGLLFAALSGLLFFLIIGIVSYVVSAIAFMKLLKKVNYDKAWLAWIPIGNMIGLVDAVIDDDEDASGIFFHKINIKKQIVMFWWVALFVLCFIPVIGSLLGLALNILVLGYVYARAYEKTEGGTFESKQVLGYVSAFIPIIPVVKWLLLKN